MKIIQIILNKFKIINNDKKINFIFIFFVYFYFYILVYQLNGDWGLGIGDWGLGIGAWAQSPIPNPQSPCNLIFL